MDGRGGTAWAVPGHGEKYGGSFVQANGPASDDGRHLAAVAGPRPDDKAGGLLNPRNPLFWFGVIAAASVGLMAYSTTARVGPVSASLDVGK